MRLGATVRPEVVAREALRVLGRRTTVAPGGRSKVLAGSLRAVPRSVRVRIMEQVMAGFTRHQA